jgi:hypothetical protein
MRTNIEIDDRLMRQALRASGRTTKRGVVDEALKLLVQTRSQAGISKLRGRIRWEDEPDPPRDLAGHPNRAGAARTLKELRRLAVFANGASSWPRRRRATTAHFASASARCGRPSTD